MSMVSIACTRHESPALVDYQYLLRTLFHSKPRLLWKWEQPAIFVSFVHLPPNLTHLFGSVWCTLELSRRDSASLRWPDIATICADRRMALRSLPYAVRLRWGIFPEVALRVCRLLRRKRHNGFASVEFAEKSGRLARNIQHQFLNFDQVVGRRSRYPPQVVECSEFFTETWRQLPTSNVYQITRSSFVRSGRINFLTSLGSVCISHHRFLLLRFLLLLLLEADLEVAAAAARPARQSSFRNNPMEQFRSFDPRISDHLKINESRCDMTVDNVESNATLSRQTFVTRVK